MNTYFWITCSVICLGYVQGQRSFVSNDVLPGMRPMGSILTDVPNCGYVYVGGELIIKDCQNRVCMPIPEVRNGSHICSDGNRFESWCRTECDGNLVTRGHRMNKCNSVFKRWIYNFATCEEVCGPGFYVLKGTSYCEECPKGTYSNANTVANTNANTVESCFPCPLGTTTNHTGSTTSEDCIQI